MESHPNILLILLDATRRDHLSCYGYGRETTPNIDRLAADGVVYEQAISQACWTLPSHASMFTGLYALEHGVHFENPHLNENTPTLAQKLSAHGYQTAGFPNGAAWLSSIFGFHRGFDTYRTRPPWMEKLAVSSSGGAILSKIYDKLYRGRNGRLSREVNRWTQNWFRRQYDPDKPFFMFLSYGDAHIPWFGHQCTSRFLGKDINKALQVNQDMHRYIAGKVKMSQDDFHLLNGLYDGEIYYMDAMIGRLLKKLEKHTDLKDCLVLITADHGENIGDHGLMGHQYCLYDTLLHVPLIIKFPDSTHAGTRVDELIELREIGTSLLSTVGIAANHVRSAALRDLSPPSIASNPLLFTVSEELSHNFRRMKRKHPDFDTSVFPSKMRALRQKDYKLIWSSNGQKELYDLGSDPGETTDLYNDMPKIAGSLEEQLYNWQESISAAKRQFAEVDCDENISQRLKDLGYL